MNVHHIVQEADGGPNTLENAICLCLRCHAEAGHFNARHPMGTKYSPNELRAHRDQWWEHCLGHPDEPFTPALEVGYRALSRHTDLHRYRLSVRYRNELKEVQVGWKLQLFFPFAVPVRTGDFDEYEVEHMHERCHAFEYESGARIWPGEVAELVPTDSDYFFIEYEVDHNLYMKLCHLPPLRWRLYAPNVPPVEGEKSLFDLQEF